MAKNKKYYYLKLKDTFFNSEEMKVLESMKNGIEYQNLYLRLCLLSLKYEGVVTFRPNIPYNPEMLSTVLSINIDTIRTGIKVLTEMGLVEQLDSGQIYMTDIQLFIGKSSTEAERIMKSRKCLNKGGEHLLNICTPEIEIEKELELKKEKKKDSEKSEAIQSPFFEDALFIAQELERLHQVLVPSFTGKPERWAKDIDYLLRLDKKDKDEVLEVLRWAKNPKSFWFPNIISGKKFREKYEQLLAQMLSEKEKTRPKTDEELLREMGLERLI